MIAIHASRLFLQILSLEKVNETVACQILQLNAIKVAMSNISMETSKISEIILPSPCTMLFKYLHKR